MEGSCMIEELCCEAADDSVDSEFVSGLLQAPSTTVESIAAVSNADNTFLLLNIYHSFHFANYK